MSRFDLPTDLPRPVDDGACAHLTDFRIPSLELPATNDGLIDLSSTQDTDYQKEAAERLHLPYSLLSDNTLLLSRALRLPTFGFANMTLIKRLTLIIDQGVITKVFYPVFPPDESANETLHWLKEHPLVAM